MFEKIRAVRHRHADATALRRRGESLAAQLTPPEDTRTSPWRAGFGRHPSRRPGPGDQFWQFRRYQAGDSATMIDWRRSAASTHVHIREREFETPEAFAFWCDRSPSMDFAGPASRDSKRTEAAVMILALALSLSRSIERVRLFPGAEAEPLTRLDDWADIFADEDPPVDAGPPGVERLRRHHAVFISDFLDDPDRLARRFRAYGAAGIGGVVIHLLDGAECDLPYRGHVLFEDVEISTESERIENVAAVREAYRKRRQAWQDEIQAMARQAGWTYLFHRTDHPPLDCLRKALTALSDRP